MLECVFAFTPADPSGVRAIVYPPYINVSRDAAGDFIVTVRSPATEHPDHPREGATACMTLPRDEGLNLHRALLRDLIETTKA